MGGLYAPLSVASDLAPVHECVWKGDRADVTRLPIVRHYAMDIGPVITMTHVMKSRAGFYDISFAKTFFKGDPRRMVVDIHTRDLSRMRAEYHQRDEPAPIVNVVGHHPAFSLGALAPLEWGNDDYASAGSFLGEPLRLTPSVTWGEAFMVPADAELVIEGEIPPGQQAICDPFGEVAGMYQPQCLRSVFDVKAITFRRNAILQDIFSGYRDGWNLNAVSKEGWLFEHLKVRFPSVSAVHSPDSGAALLVAYIAVDDPDRDGPQEVGRAALEHWSTLQSVIVVDPDIDVFDETQVQWALQTFSDPELGRVVHRDLPPGFFTTASTDRKVVIDATRPRTVAFPARHSVPEDALRRVDLAEWLA
jgi:UbiD family decarboxylase